MGASRLCVSTLIGAARLADAFPNRAPVCRFKPVSGLVIGALFPGRFDFGLVAENAVEGVRDLVGFQDIHVIFSFALSGDTFVGNAGWATPGQCSVLR